jgi:hypothetical protein
LAPGSAANFGILFGVSTDGANVSFSSVKSDGELGIYRTVNGAIELVADQDTAIPGGSGNFQLFGRSQIQGDTVAFTGGVSSGSMLFTSDSNGLTRLLAEPVVIGGTSQTLTFFRSISLVGDDLAISADGAAGGRGLFSLIDGTLDLIADNTTSVTGGSGEFFAFTNVDFNGSDVAFQAIGPVVKRFDRDGIYTNRNGSLELIANAASSPPNDLSQTFEAFTEPHIDGSTVYFRANYNSSSVDGVYSDSGSGLTLEVDSTLATFPFGGGGRLKAAFGLDAVDNGNILLNGFDTLTPGEARYLRYNDEWHVVIRVGDILDGVAVQNIKDATLSGYVVALTLDMADGTDAVYIAVTPEPTSAIIFCVTITTLLRRQMG